MQIWSKIENFMDIQKTGRHFFNCHLSKCNYWRWADGELPVEAKDTVNLLLDKNTHIYICVRDYSPIVVADRPRILTKLKHKGPLHRWKRSSMTPMCNWNWSRITPVLLRLKQTHLCSIKTESIKPLLFLSECKSYIYPLSDLYIKLLQDSCLHQNFTSTIHILWQKITSNTQVHMYFQKKTSTSNHPRLSVTPNFSPVYIKLFQKITSNIQDFTCLH